MPATRRSFLAASAAAAIPHIEGPSAIGTRIPGEMKTYRDADTGRTVRQYTSAKANSYPLYYFTPSITADGRYCILHSERSGWVQLYRLDLASGEMVQLTAGTTRDAGWFIWCEGHLRGIFNHLSSLNTVRREVYYFQDDEVRATHVDSLENRRVMRMPGRMPIGQTTFSPDGRWFAFVHADERMFREQMADRDSLLNMNRAWWSTNWRELIPCTIGAIETATGKYHDVVELDYHVHHVIFPANDYLLVNHIKGSAGMWRIGLDGKDRRDLRPLVHQVVTERGVFYESPARLVPGSGAVKNWFGCYDLTTDRHEEVPLPKEADGYVHVGWDPAGRMLFFENAGQKHELLSFHFPFLKDRTVCRRIRTLDAYPRPGQRSHAHPFLAPDRQWLFHTAAVEGFSQVCAVDVKDLADLPEYWERRS